MNVSTWDQRWKKQIKRENFIRHCVVNIWKLNGISDSQASRTTGFNCFHFVYLMIPFRWRINSKVENGIFFMPNIKTLIDLVFDHMSNTMAMDFTPSGFWGAKMICVRPYSVRTFSTICKSSTTNAIAQWRGISFVLIKSLCQCCILSCELCFGCIWMALGRIRLWSSLRNSK